MPLFFVDTVDGHEFYPDEDGSNFCDLDAALESAMRCAREMLDGSRGTNTRVIASVRDHSGRTIATVTASAVLDLSPGPVTADD